MTSIARVGGTTVEQRVWRFIRKQPAPILCRDIAQEFHYSMLRMGGVLRRLRLKGSIIVHGGNNTTRYSATDVRPDDLRGTAPGTMEVLRRQQVPSHQLHAHRTAPRGRKSPGRPGFDLARAWPSPITK